MLNLHDIHKPKTLDEALELLKQPDTVVLAGGTELVARQRRDVRAVVDLSGLGLAYIREQDGGAAIGATTTLAEAAESPRLSAAANGAIAQAAQRSAASLLRNQATVVGTLIAEPDGILATVLAAVEATLTLHSRSAVLGASRPSSGGEGRVRVVDFLARRADYLRGGIVTEVVIPASWLKRRAVIETVERTPRDKPIVVVCAALEAEKGVVRAAAIALGGVGEVAVRAAEAEERVLGQELTDQVIESAARAAMNELNPSSDFRGSAEYRREMVRVLAARALRDILRSL